mmetsp:Transcript_22345/g.61306  ORF Transcript_22345/g.61306 Transcript_22345/m.61306 type:complete len:135 (-) Transcript_22345:13-417(-)
MRARGWQLAAEASWGEVEDGRRQASSYVPAQVFGLHAWGATVPGELNLYLVRPWGARAPPSLHSSPALGEERRNHPPATRTPPLAAPTATHTTRSPAQSSPPAAAPTAPAPGTDASRKNSAISAPQSALPLTWL